MADGVEISNLQLPLIKGDKGETGEAGKIVNLTVTMLPSTSSPTVENIGTQSEANYIIGIPVGTGISTAQINLDGELVLTLTDNTVLNLGVVVGTSVSSATINNDYDLIITLTDGTVINAGNLEDKISDMITTSLVDYYDKDTADETFGNSIDLSINPSTYVLTVNLLDNNGTTLSTDTVDLPLETMVVSGRYDNATKKVILTLQNGNTVEFSVADLVSGLQSEITNANKLSADLVDDTSTTHKFVTSAQKTIIDSVKTDYAHSLSISFNNTTNELTVGLNDYSGNTLDSGAVDFDDILTDYVKNTDYATSSKGGVVKVQGSGNGVDMSNGNIYPLSITAEEYATKGNYYFISKGTLENVLNARIGDIETILETLNTGSGVE